MRFTAGISEIVLVVSDVLASARFYQEVIGLEPDTPPNESWAWFWAGEREQKQRIALHKGPLLFEEHSPRPPDQRWGPVHFALEVPRSRLEAAVDQVRDAGVDVFGPNPLNWMAALSYYFYDPDGNLLEFWSPDPEESTT